jgi:gas vesicle protein
MGQDPREIRQEIEDTRARVGDTVEALGHKTDVKARAKESVSERVESVRSRLGGASSAVSERTPSGGDVKQGAKRAAGIAQENPIGLAIGGVAVGFVAGMLVPSTRVEDEKVGPLADQVKEKARDTGHEALERGKEVAQEAAQSAKETAQQKGQQQADELRSSAQQKAQEARDEV